VDNTVIARELLVVARELVSASVSDVENAFRDHLSMTGRYTTKEDMRAVIHHQFGGRADMVFGHVWDSLVKEGYLKPARGGYMWEM